MGESESKTYLLVKLKLRMRMNCVDPYKFGIDYWSSDSKRRARNYISIPYNDDFTLQQN